MQVVSEVVSTGRPAMSIKDSEEADLWPFELQMRFVLGLQNVENDADTVLVVVPDDALVRVRRV